MYGWLNASLKSTETRDELSTAFSHPYIFFHLLVNGFSVTSFRTFFYDPFPSLHWRAVTVGREKLKWCQLAYHQLTSNPKTSF